ncbi:MAG: hypothetical protein ACREFQ_01360, partial [Stellaceae bacterium]
MRSPSEIVRAASASFTVVSFLLLSACHAASGESPGDAAAQQQDDLGLIGGVMQQVEKSYVHPVGNQQLTTNALKGMLTRLDPHS